MPYVSRFLLTKSRRKKPPIQSRNITRRNACSLCVLVRARPSRATARYSPIAILADLLMKRVHTRWCLGAFRRFANRPSQHRPARVLTSAGAHRNAFVVARGSLMRWCLGSWWHGACESVGGRFHSCEGRDVIGVCCVRTLMNGLGIILYGIFHRLYDGLE